MKQWHAETVSGFVNELEKALQRVETQGGVVFTVLSGSTPYPSWTVVWYEAAP